MTSSIFDQSIACADEILKRFQTVGTAHKERYTEDYPSVDFSFASANFRRAHLSIVDARESKKIWMMHCCVFPTLTDPSPIFGFDIIAGPSRASGAFQDFSCGGEIDHPMMKWFTKRAEQAAWKRERELPEWGQRIFSKDIVAVGNLDELELTKFIEFGLENLDYYLSHVGGTIGDRLDTTVKHNYYCANQKLNPHTPRFMQSLGLTELQATKFMNEVLFPELAKY